MSEQYLLDLEREAFVSLCGHPKTQARIEHMLKTGWCQDQREIFAGVICLNRRGADDKRITHSALFMALG